MKVKARPLEREFIKVSGRDALRFLQGMLTADVKRASSLIDLYTCARSFLLSNKGKIVSELLLLVKGEKEIFISCKNGYGSKVVETLNHFIIADDVELTLSEDAFQVWTLPWGLAQMPAIEVVPPQVPDALDVIFKVSEISGALFLPRAQLGAQHGELWLAKCSRPQFEFEDVSEDEILKLRIDAGVPEWGVDLTEESFLLEYPVQDAISFFKGCYIGQEVVARTTYRGHVVRGFARFQLNGPAEKAQFLVLESSKEKPVGRLSSVYESQALGQLRLEHLSQALVGQDNPVSVVKVELLIQNKKE